MTPGQTTSTGSPPNADSAPRVRLVVQSGMGTGTRIDCTRVVTLLGSRKGCKVNLKHRRVSPVHVAVVNTGSAVFAVDLVTRYGTILNDLKMEHECLSDGDILTIRPWRFRVDIEKAAHKGERDAHPFGLEPSPHVVAFELLSNGRILRPDRDVCLIGRRSGCDITISDRQVSRAHALLVNYYGHPAISDLLSHNRTLVNDAAVGFHVLADGDVVQVGDTRFRARLMASGVHKNVSDNGRTALKSEVPLAAPAAEGDMIDIGQVEGTQRWHIADKLERASRKK